MIERTITVTLYTEKGVKGVTYTAMNEADYFGIFGLLADFCDKLKELKIIRGYFITSNYTKGDLKQ